jgi:prepilin-type processing-associated H-X9-DG protein
MKPEPDDDVFTISVIDPKKTRLENVTAVGNYAINIVWGDGHTAGIYNWKYLYSLCQKMREREES